jgi:4-amino-4-deoxy-L-arabinose transferase-like glycosyltransferase
MGHKKSPAIDSKKGEAHRESNGWLFTVISSKWVILLILILAGIVWYGFYATHTKGVAGSDDREYASIARNIAEGKGIVRNFIYPIDIHFFSKWPVPELHHPPGFPVLMAGFFKLFGISEFAALLPSYLSYFLLIPLLFFFVKKYLDVKTAALAAILLIFNKDILDLSLVALTEIIYTFVLFLFFVLLVNAKTLRAIFVAGLLLGMSQLIRKSFYPFLPPLFIYFYLYHREFRWKKMALFSLGLLLPILPSLTRSFFETGSPFFSYNQFVLMSYSEKYPEMVIWRDIEAPSLFEFLKQEPGQFLSKYLSHFMNLITNLLSVSNSYLLAFFSVEMFYWKVDSDWKRVKALFLLIFLSQVLFIPLHTFLPRYFIPFLPVMIAFASQGLIRMATMFLSEAKVRWQKGLFVLLALFFFIFFVAPSLYLILRPNGPPLLNRKTPQFGFLMPKEEAFRLNEFIKRELKESQIVWTDLPEILEWEGDRLCGWLPTKIEHIYEIHKKIPVDAILLTNARTVKLEDEWQYLLLSNESLPRYRSVKLYVGRKFFAKLLIRDGKE